MISFNLLKLFHLVFMVSWMAGLFFLGRLFIYQKDVFNKQSSLKEEAAAPMSMSSLFIKGAKRVMYIIIFPAMGVTLVTGLSLMTLLGALSQTWMQVKLAAVVFLVGYTFYLNLIRLKMATLGYYSMRFLRVLNEVPFLLLFFIVSLVIFKSVKAPILFLFILISVIVLGVCISMLFFKKRRDRSLFT